MKNAEVSLLATWMEVNLMQKSKLNDMQKHNILLSLDQSDEANILKNIKKKLRDLDGCNDERQKQHCLLEMEAKIDMVEAGAVMEEAITNTEKEVTKANTEEVTSDIEKGAMKIIKEQVIEVNLKRI